MRCTNNERGAVSLVEITLAMVLAMVLLGTIALVSVVAEHSAALAGSEYGAARRSGTALTSAISSLGTATPAYGCYEPVHPEPGQQATNNPPLLNVPLDQCAKMVVATQVQPANVPAPLLALATTPGSAQGLCWLAAESEAVGLVAPDLRCLVAYTDGTLWSFDWPPENGATSTTCDPTTCYGAGSAGPTYTPQPALPPEPTSTSGGVATFAGRTALASVLGCPTFSPPFAIVGNSVTINVTEGYGADNNQLEPACPQHPVGHDLYKITHYTAAIGGASGGNSWDAI